MEDAERRRAAAAAAVSVAEKSECGHPDAVKEAIKVVLDTAETKIFRERGKKAVDKLQATGNETKNHRSVT